MADRIEYLRRLYRLIASHSSRNQNGAARQKRGCHARPILTHLTVNRPDIGVWIIDLVYIQKSTLKRGASDDDDPPIRQKQRPVVGTMVEHMVRSGKALLNWIKDIDLVMGARPGKASGDQHLAIEHQRHGVIRARDKHCGGQEREAIRRGIKHPGIGGGLAADIPPGNKDRGISEQHRCMVRAIRGRIRCLRKDLRIRIKGISLFAPNDQDPSILKQRRGVLLSRDRHQMSHLRELTGRRIVDLCCFQQRQIATLFASREQHPPIREQSRCVVRPRRGHVAGRREMPTIVKQRGIERGIFIHAASDQHLACIQPRCGVARPFRRKCDGRLRLCRAGSEQSKKGQ